MTAITQHEITRSARSWVLTGGIVCLSIALLPLLMLAVDPSGSVTSNVAVALFAAVLLYGAVWSFWAFLTPGRYTVFLSGFGIRIGSGRWIRWSEITHTRPQFFLQRLDLLDAKNHLLGSVEYQVEGAETVLARIRDVRNLFEGEELSGRGLVVILLLKNGRELGLSRVAEDPMEVYRAVSEWLCPARPSAIREGSDGTPYLARWWFRCRGNHRGILRTQAGSPHFVASWPGYRR